MAKIEVMWTQSWFSVELMEKYFNILFAKETTFYPNRCFATFDMFFSRMSRAFSSVSKSTVAPNSGCQSSSK